MNVRCAWLVVAAAGGAVRGQETAVVSYSWSEVMAGSSTPVLSPNSVVEPGEGALIRLSLFAKKNGVDAIGQTTTYIPPPPPGVGTIRGIGSFFCTLSGNQGALSAAGTWSNRAFSPVLPDGNYLGGIVENGATLYSLGCGQSIAPGQTANATNPIFDVFGGAWTPSAYTPRVVQFRARSAGQFDQDCSVIIRYGSGFTDPTDPTTEYPLYVWKFIAADFGSGINIPIAPCPATAWLSLGLAVVSRRRRGR